MKYNMDEIYHLLMWDNQLSFEENEVKIQKGIDAAKQTTNLFPFMQPVIVPPEKSKLVWEPCAKVVAMRSDEELEPFLFMLLEWIQDLNWPGAMIIYDRLSQIPLDTIRFAFDHSRKTAEQTKDASWLAVLEDLYEDIIKKA